MRDYFRWQFWAPRVLMIVVGLLALQYGLCLLTRGRVERALDARLGVQSRVAAARASFIDGRIVVAGLQVADPLRPSCNLLEADVCDVNLDLETLLGDRVYDGRGQIAGLRLLVPGSPRPIPGAGLEGAPVRIAIGERETEQAASWMRQLNERFSRDWTEQFPSLAMTSELAARSTERYAALAQRSRELQARARDLEARAAAAERNPLRNEAYYAAAPAEIAALAAEMATLTAEIENLPDSLETGRRAVVAARAGDESFVRQCLSTASPDGRVLANYLFREQARELVAQSVGWLRFARQIVPPDASRTHVARRRGEDIVFPGCRRPPDLRLRTLALSGTMYLAGRPVEMQGTLEDFTAEPWLLDRPMQLRLSSVGTPAINVRLLMDRSGNIARDELLMDCRDLPLPSCLLGHADGIQISVAPVVAAVNISIRLEGDRLSGDVQCVENGVQMSVAAGKELAGARLADPLQEAFGGIGAFATRLSLSGSMEEPSCTIWSDLGPAAAAAIDVAARRAADQRARELASAAQRRVDEQLARIERQASDAQEKLLADLSTSSQNLQWLAAQSAVPERLNIQRLGRLPAQSLFR